MTEMIPRAGSLDPTDQPAEILPNLGTGVPCTAIEFAVVIPTFNERENIPLLIASLKRVLGETGWEIIFVDDNSPDGTAELLREIAAQDRRIRVLERVGRRGLSSACIEGMLATPAAYIAVMDADLQHDENVLPAMLARMKAERLDVVVASRNIAGGSMGNFLPQRVWLSKLGNRISRIVCRCDISDPMSGFFLVDGNFFKLVAHRLTGAGFKILVDLIASSPRSVRIAEVGYSFRNRQRGESKLDINVGLEYLFLIIDKLIGRYVPTRFVLFALVGTVGVVVHLACLGLLLRYAQMEFVLAQTFATVVAITFNFFLNNAVTFRDVRLRGSRLLLGWFTFLAACSVGALMNVTFARALYASRFPWYIAGAAGLVISSVWNYGVNTVLTWRRVRR